jgi:hypothetical protein
MPRTFNKRQKRKVYLFCCEDNKSSRIYLNAVKSAYGVNIQTITSGDMRPAALRKRLKREIDSYNTGEVKEGFCLFDRDELSVPEFKQETEKTHFTYKKVPVSAAVSSPCYEYWLLLHLRKTDKGFHSSHECCECLKNEINRQNNLDLSVEEMKKRNDIFTLVGGKEGLQRAIQNARSYAYYLSGTPYTNMHDVIEGILNQNNQFP